MLDEKLNLNHFKIKKRDVAHKHNNQFNSSVSRESSDMYYNPNLSKNTISQRENTNDPSSHYLSDIDDPMEVFQQQ